MKLEYYERNDLFYYRLYQYGIDNTCCYSLL